MSVGMFRVTELPGDVFISSSVISHPDAPYERYAIDELTRNGVRSILNVSSDVHVREHHRRIYRKLGIAYEEYRIDDKLEAPSAGFLDTVKKLTRDLPRPILINCSAGINRSAMAACALVRPHYESVQAMLKDMRMRQYNQRQMQLLMNPVFESHVTSQLI